ncbi:MAG: N-acetylmuramoyl-L-alanine amidase [Sporichthyaceae bacterium]
MPSDHPPVDHSRAGSAPAYRRGDNGPAVAEIRSKLGVLGLLAEGEGAELLDPQGALFDEATDRAVRAFQQARGISVDGVVGARTYHALDEARWRLGDRILFFVPARLMAGDDVATLQQRLLDMGFDCGRVDGLFGVETEQALREFQRNIGVGADGTCGPATFKALTQLSHTVVGGSPHAMRDSEAITRAGPALAGKLVIIDPARADEPGHAGRDLVYDIASRLEGRLSATGASAFLTRGPESSAQDVPSEEDQASFANAAGADLLLSVHVNRHPTPAASGVATYYYGNDEYGHRSAVGERLADLVQREICARTDLVDCRVHPKTWDVLRRTRMPAVRVEVGYLSNPGDAARLADPAFRDALAEAIGAAVQRLYLAPEDDAVTGVLRIPEWLRA